MKVRWVRVPRRVRSFGAPYAPVGVSLVCSSRLAPPLVAVKRQALAFAAFPGKTHHRLEADRPEADPEEGR